MTTITAQPLTREAFAPFGQIIDTAGAHRYPINGGMTERFHDLATATATGPDARVILSIFRGRPCTLPHALTMVERHPFGSQAFMPLQPRPFLVVVCPDETGKPGLPHAFLTEPGQGVNYPAGLWHGVLTPLDEEQGFLVVDRAGPGANLEEYTFSDPYEIVAPGHRPAP